MPAIKTKQAKVKSQTLTQILEKLKEFELALKLSSNLDKKELLLIQRQFKKILKTA